MSTSLPRCIEAFLSENLRLHALIWCDGTPHPVELFKIHALAGLENSFFSILHVAFIQCQITYFCGDIARNRPSTRSNKNVRTCDCRMKPTDSCKTIPLRETILQTHQIPVLLAFSCCKRDSKESRGVAVAKEIWPGYLLKTHALQEVRSTCKTGQKGSKNF